MRILPGAKGCSGRLDISCSYPCIPTFSHSRWEGQIIARTTRAPRRASKGWRRCGATREVAMLQHWFSRRAPPLAASAPARHLIELRRVVKTYTSAAGAFTALKGVDLQIEPGEF